MSNKEIMVRKLLLDYLPRAAVDCAADCVVADLVIDDPRVSRVRGREALAVAISAMHASFAPFIFDLEGFVEQGLRTAVLWTMHGTDRHGTLANRANGKIFSLTGITWIQFAGDRIAGVRTFLDRTRAAVELGGGQPFIQATAVNALADTDKRTTALWSIFK